MRSPLCFVFASAIVLLGGAGLRGAEAPPISQFTRNVVGGEVSVSADGQYVAFIAGVGDGGYHHVLALMNLATGKIDHIDTPFPDDNTRI